MIQVILTGTSGAMGKHLIEQIQLQDQMTISAGIDRNLVSDCPFPQHVCFDKTAITGDVIIDFSHPSLLQELLDFAVEKQIPAVICTTGLDAVHHAAIAEAAKQVPIFISGNMSLGINLLIHLAKTAALTLGEDWDIEIIEKHHRRKLDAPSGTALMIAKALQDLNEQPHPLVSGRNGKDAKRALGEIGLHAVRGGTIVGEHEVLFAGHDECVSIHHSASSRSVFAKGAIRATSFIIGRPAGLYSMDDLLNNITETLLNDTTREGATR